MYDDANATIIMDNDFGISAAVVYALSVWNGDSIDDSLKRMVGVGIKIWGVTYIDEMLAPERLNDEILNGYVTDVLAAFETSDKKAAASALAVLDIEQLKDSELNNGNDSIFPLPSVSEVSLIFKDQISYEKLFNKFEQTGYYQTAVLRNQKNKKKRTFFSRIKMLLSKKRKIENHDYLEILPECHEKLESVAKTTEKKFIQLCDEYLFNRKEAEVAANDFLLLLSDETISLMAVNGCQSAQVIEMMKPIFEKISSARKTVSMPDKKSHLKGLSLILKKISCDNFDL